MLRATVFIGVLSQTATAFKCIAFGDDGQSDCSGTLVEDGKNITFLDVCYSHFSEAKNYETGSIGSLSISSCYRQDWSMMNKGDLTKPGCNDNGCWCVTENCNTNNWAIQAMTEYVSPPLCFSGIAGSNMGETCTNNKVYTSEGVSCDKRIEGASSPQAACEVDSHCKYYSEGECSISDFAKGMECEQRIFHGCYEKVFDPNNVTRYSLEKEGFQTSDGISCHEIKDENSCNTATEANNISPRKCTWIPKPEDMKKECATRNSGSLNVCDYNDGQGPPGQATVAAGFEHSLFTASDPFNNKCSLIASFRTGYGSAVTLGNDKTGLISENCKTVAYTWETLAEHINHTSDTIKEYCDNFIPDASVMATFNKTSPGDIIAETKAGNLFALFPTLKDHKFIVTAKPEFGECLFTSKVGVWGLAVCVCKTVRCNNNTALSFIVDTDVGPMRLLQFIDGSLKEDVAAINAIVPNLLDEDGNFIPSKANDVTEEHVNSFMLVPSVADRTTKEELWGIIQDYQKLNTFIEAGGDPNDPPSTKTDKWWVEGDSEEDQGGRAGRLFAPGLVWVLATTALALF